MRNYVSCIVGATATGKSAIAEEVALRLHTHVVSIDAMQVYRGMDIGTAKTPKEKRRCPLDMIDVADAGEDYSAQRFQHDARHIIDNIITRGNIPILCGGTGLYLDAVIDELEFPKGKRGGRTRAYYEAFAEHEGAQATWELLASRDQESAKLIHPHNLRRVIRALEMCDEGTSYATRSGGIHSHVHHYEADIWGLTMNRGRLYRRINRRVEAMLSDGLVEEVRALKACGLSLNTTAGQAIGYKEVLSYLDGAISYDEARDLIQKNTRRYAKRQMSWFKRDPRILWLDLDEMDEEEAIEIICSRTQEVGRAQET